MNKQQKEKIKKVLLKKREELVRKVKNLQKESLGTSQREASGDLSGYTFHMADVASDNFEREMSLGLAASEQELLNQIDDALGRLKEKDFGKCRDCGKIINMKRLTAVPYAEMCISCQKQADKRSK